jgi:DNA-binding IclR family transcriptional regulator
MEMQDRQAPVWQVKSVYKAMELLTLFTEEQTSWSLAALSSVLDQPKSTISNMLRTLEEGGMLQREEGTGAYRLGLACMELGYRARSTVPILQYAMPFLEDLQVETDKIVYLTIPRNGRVFYLEAIFPGRRSIHYSVAGKTLPMHCTGCGKAMLAYMQAEEIAMILDKHGLSRLTDATITDRDRLLDEMRVTRQRGYAVDNGEESTGVRCVAVPIMNHGAVLGAVSLSGSPLSIRDEDLPGLAVKIMEVTNHLSARSELFPKGKTMQEQR